MKLLRFSLFILITILLMAGMVGPAALAQSSTWSAAYYNNPSLAGVPVLTLNEPDPSHDWGTGSPAVGVPVDNFSARWTTTAFVNAGAYQISVRPDDGVRVYVDGIVYIDQFYPQAGNLYQAVVNLSAGTHTFTVEYFEATGVANLAYNFTAIGGNPPPGSGPTATVTAYFLNVRAAPNPSAAILARISRGETYPVIGRNASTTWLQLNVNGLIGWVNASYVTAYNIGGVPITDGGQPPPPPPGGAFATVITPLLNVRSIPNPFTGAILTQIAYGQTYPVVGRNADTTWLQLNVNGLIGWVNARYVSATNLGSVPITDPGTNPTGAFGTVTAYYLNVRSAPFAWAPRLTVISRGQTFPVIGRNAASTWVQLNVNGLIGWVNRSWMQVSNLQNVPITG